MGKPEGAVEKYLRTYAEAHGFKCYKFKSPANSGVPDRLLIGHGVTFFVETKAPNGKLRPLQEEVQRDMKQYGAVIFNCDSKEKCKRVLDNIIAQKNSARHENVERN